MRLNRNIIILVLLCLCRLSPAQSVRPVTASLSIAPPYTTSLSDYIGDGATRTQLIITLNDLNEVTWDTRLRISIEGNGIRLVTRNDFRPAQPLVIYRDAPNVLSGSDLDIFFNPSNTVVEGTTRGDVFSNNKLPEGFYNICIEVLDYATGKLLSNKSCTYVSMQLPNVPIVVTPRCSSVISTSAFQQILFSWNPAQSINGLQGGVPEYQLSIYEVTSKEADPLYAIQNGKALLQFTGDWIKTTNYLYSAGDPALDPGKRYAFRVQARYENSDVALKNNGYSEPCFFYYGYPEGGSINTLAPAIGASFKAKDPLLFSWNMPDNVLAGQKVAYELVLVKLSEGQLLEDALQQNEPFYFHRYPEIIPSTKFEIQLPVKLDPKTDYAWKVYAYSDNRMVAESKATMFHGPALLEKFYAGNHIVQVEQTENSDLNNLKGTGKVYIGNGKTQTIEFNNISLKYSAGNWVLIKGEIIQALTDTTLIAIRPKLAINSQAWFHPQNLRLTSEGMYMGGYIHWPFPHATEDERQAKASTEEVWMNYNDYTLMGTVCLTNNNKYNLLEPYGYRIELSKFSEVIVYKNEYRLRLHGNIVCPEIIKTTSSSGDKVSLPFQNADQLFYFNNNDLTPTAGILPVKNVQLFLNPINYTIDLTENTSPGKQLSKPEWKGIYFEKTELKFLEKFDQAGQLHFLNDTKYVLTPVEEDSNLHYLDSDGHTFRFLKDFNEGYDILLNTFPAQVNHLAIDIQKSVLQNSNVRGSMLIPFISSTKKFTYTCPLTIQGLNPGYMNDLENYSFTFKPDKPEEMIRIKILRAVFADQERLDMSLSMEWPFLDVTLESITDFYAWGDYHIGFYRKNGTRFLDNQVAGKVTDYTYTVNMVSAGRGAGHYAIGFSGTVVIGDDVSGASGAPMLNLYSTSPNSMIPFEEDTWSNGDQSNGNTLLLSNEVSIEQQLEIVKKQLAKEVKNSVETIEYIASTTSLDEYHYIGDSTLTLPGDSILADTSVFKRSGWLSKLNNKEYELLEQFIDEFIRLGADIVSTKIQVYSDKLSIKFNRALDKPQRKANEFVDLQIHRIIDTLTAKIARSLIRDSFDPSEQLFFIADTVADELAIEINRSINLSVKNNIRTPVTAFIKAQMVDSVRSFIAKKFKSRVHELMEGRVTMETFAGEVLNDIPVFLERSGRNIMAFIRPANIASMIEKTTISSIRGINMDNVASRLSGGVIKNTKGIVGRTLEGIAEQQLNGLVHNVIRSIPGVDAVAPPSVQLNFNNLGQKIKEGRIDQIVTLDPTNISLNTKFVSFAGGLKHTKDSVYGNAWRGAFAITVKQPKPFAVEAVFLSGKKKGEEFWFCQVSPAPPGSKPGGKLDKRPKPFSTPAHVGPIEIVAGTGRVYKHMKEINRGTNILPDSTIKYGAYFNLIMFDASNHGKTARVAVEAEYILTDSGAFTVEFDGNVQVLSNTVSIEKPDMTALVYGDLHLYYNSAEEHFLANGHVAINKPGSICGQGSFLLETKPGFWRVAVGEKDFPVKIIPSCNSWGALGWLYVDQRSVEIGAGIGFYARAEAKFEVGPIGGGLGIDAGVELKAWVAVQYKPKLALNEIGVQARGWVHIYSYYNYKNKSATIDLVDIEIGLEGVIHINPKPAYVEGKIWGHIKVLIFGIDFDAGFKKEVA